MEVIKRKKLDKKTRTFKPVEYIVYTKDEADNMGIKYTYWRDTDEVGWVLTDDNYVGELLEVTEHVDKSNGRTNKLAKYSFATLFLARNKAPLLVEERIKNRSYGRMDGKKTWLDAEAAKHPTKDAITYYAGQLLAGNKIDWGKVAKIQGTDSRHPIHFIKKLFKNDKVKSMVSKEMQLQMSDKGLTESWVVDKILDVIKLSEDKENPVAMLKAVDKIADFLGLNDKMTVSGKEEVNYTNLLENTKKTLDVSATTNRLPTNINTEYRDVKEEDYT